MNKRTGILTLLIGLLLAVGCAPAAVEPGPTEPALTPGTEPLGTPTSESPYPEPSVLSPGEVPQKFFDIALADLLAQTGADRVDVSVLKSEAITWPDGSLGCPEPNVMYTQALVDGYQVIFGVGDETFDYHLSNDGTFVLCDIVLPDGEPVSTPAE